MAWKDYWNRNKPLCIVVILLAVMVIYQQFLITDLQERMMNMEAQKYDDQLNDIRWEAETALSQNEEQQKDIIQLQGHTTKQEWRLMEMEWDTYGK